MEHVLIKNCVLGFFLNKYDGVNEQMEQRFRETIRKTLEGEE